MAPPPSLIASSRNAAAASARPSRISASIASPASASASTSTPNPILKRPSRPNPLPLSPSPFPFSAQFNLSLAGRTPGSPHVHFLPSPSSMLFSTISICSPSPSAPLTSIALSPNAVPTPFSADSFSGFLSPLSPFGGGDSGLQIFETPLKSVLVSRKIDSIPEQKEEKEEQKPKRTVHFEDPRSPRPVGTVSLTAAALKIGKFGTKPRTELGKALTSFPRSPYPSAPPLPFSDRDHVRERTEAKRRNTMDSTVLAKPSASRASASKPADNTSITFQLTPSRRLTPPHLDLRTTLGLEGVKEEVENGNNYLSDEAGESAQLSNAFWQSVSFESGGSGLLDSFPESVSASSSLKELPAVPRAVPSSRSPAKVSMLFGKSDGALWSAGLPQGLTSPRGPVVFEPPLLNVKRSTFTAPSPKDPLAKLPSFATTLMAGLPNMGMEEVIKPPPRAHLA